MIKLAKLIKEEPVTLISPTGDDELSKAIRIKDAFKHKIFSITLEDVLRNPSMVEKLEQDVENARYAINKTVEKLENTEQEKLAMQVDDCGSELSTLGNFLFALANAAEKNQESYENSNRKL